MCDSYRAHRFAWLFFALLFTIGGHGVLATLRAGFNPLDLFLAVTLAAAIASAVQERWPWELLFLGLAFLVTRGIQAVLGIEALLPIGQVLWVVASLLALVTTARQALRPGRVNAERIFAAMDVYLLAGLIFGVCYWLLEHIWPASVRAASASALDLADAIYFSFVTLAALGYGDVVPVSNAARGLATLEVIGGQIYLVVLVARLVSLYARHSEES